MEKFEGSPELPRYDGEGISPVTGLDMDYWNSWHYLTMIESLSEKDPGAIERYIKKPIQSYEEYFRGKGWGDEVERILELSNPENVRKIDALVAEFNADRERIIKEKDTKVITFFFKRAYTLISGDQ